MVTDSIIPVVNLCLEKDSDDITLPQGINIFNTNVMNFGRPTVDFLKSQVKLSIEQLYDALCNVGFAYIKNHGIPAEVITAAFDESKMFFDKEQDEKNKFQRTNNATNFGYCASETEALDPTRPGCTIK